MAEANGNRTHPGRAYRPTLVLKTRSNTSYLSPPAKQEMLYLCFHFFIKHHGR